MLPSPIICAMNKDNDARLQFRDASEWPVHVAETGTNIAWTGKLPLLRVFFRRRADEVSFNDRFDVAKENRSLVQRQI
eukprot:5054990-Pleurochrysis_carterae.AAC.1